MKRRTSFQALIGSAIATVIGNCIALGEKTKFYWPGRWSEKSLREHLLTDSKHLFDKNQLAKLTFQDCLDLHDWHHAEKHGHGWKTPYPSGKTVPGTKDARGKTNKPAEMDWDEFLEEAKAPHPEA